MRIGPALLVTLLLVIAACKPAPPETPPRLFSATGEAPLAAGQDPVKEAGGVRLEATLEDTLRLVGVKLPAARKRGERAEIVLWWRVEAPLSEAAIADLKVFVHGQGPFAELNQTQGDHELLGGKVPLGALTRGDILEDRSTLLVPANYPADVLEVRAGLYQGKKRWEVEEDAAHGGDDRVLLGKIAISDGPPALPTATAKRRKGEVTIDGVLDEADWQAAERLGPFVSYDGRRALKHPTYARLVWDDTYLYVAFECDDADIHTPYDKRDDPLYESEAVEIFLDADGDLDEYVELQAAPNDVHFDAAFKGGRRKNFDTKYDVAYETQARLDGTLNDNRDRDRGWVSEWRIPIAEIRDVPRKPAPGESWRINLFRLERLRKGDRVVGTEASAWSSPLSGDFHNIARFGTLRFAE